MTVSIIANPVAGTGRSKSFVPILQTALMKAGHIVRVNWTQGPQHATELAQQIRPKSDCLVVSGGDGTINEVLNGVDLRHNTPISILSAGSLNILARELNLVVPPEHLASIICRQKKRRVELGIVDSQRKFAMLCSAGFDAHVIRTVHENRKTTLGARRIIFPILRTLLSYSPREIRVTINGGRMHLCKMAVVAKVKTYAGILHVADQAECDSGRLDVVLFKEAGLRSMLQYMWRGWRRTLSKDKGVAYYYGTSVRIETTEETDVQIDGEFYGTTPVSIQLSPHSLPFIVP